jgi:transcriptional regulator with XRE-family HTH domain
MAKPSPTARRNPALKAFGKAVRELRIQYGYSQEELAGMAGLDRSYMGGIERGEHNIALINIQKIADALDLSVSDLLKTAGI